MQRAAGRAGPSACIANLPGGRQTRRWKRRLVVTDDAEHGDDARDHDHEGHVSGGGHRLDARGIQRPLVEEPPRPPTVTSEKDTQVHGKPEEERDEAELVVSAIAGEERELLTAVRRVVERVLDALAHPEREQDAERDHGEEVPADERRHGAAVGAMEVEAQVAIGRHAQLKLARPHDDPGHAENRECERDEGGPHGAICEAITNTTYPPNTMSRPLRMASGWP